MKLKMNKSMFGLVEIRHESHMPYSKLNMNVAASFGPSSLLLVVMVLRSVLLFTACGYTYVCMASNCIFTNAGNMK